MEVLSGEIGPEIRIGNTDVLKCFGEIIRWGVCTK